MDQNIYGELHPYWASLSDVRVIMTIMYVLMIELQCQAVMEQIPALECLLSGTRGHL
jgi:hypothetical protein